MKNENVLYAARADLEKFFDLTRDVFSLSVAVLNQIPFSFVPRADAENDPTKKQLIPYVLVQNAEGRLLSYRRCGSEKRLAQKLSLGIGGHVNDGDLKDSLYGTMVAGVCREIKEEIGIDAVPEQLKLRGLINEEITEVGHVHTGVVFTLAIDASSVSFDTEIGSPQWIEPKELDETSAELWSALALKLL